MAWQPDKQFFEDFPRLDPRRTNWKYTSRSTSRYNCLAFAAGDKHRRWWPCEGRFWPVGYDRNDSVEAIERFFVKCLRFRRATDGRFVSGFHKIAVFSLAGSPTHACRQTPARSGWWKSKLGDNVDIIHDLGAISGPLYGEPTLFLERPAGEYREAQRSLRKLIRIQRLPPAGGTGAATLWSPEEG